jgi:hypothetical protein
VAGERRPRITDLAGATGLSCLEHNPVVQALIEHFVGSGGDHPVPYDDTER